MSKLYIKNIIRRLRHFNIIIVPLDPNISTKGYKISSIKLFIAVLIYSILMLFSGFYLFTYLNLSSVLLPESFYYLSGEKKEIKELNQKIFNLAKEIEKLQINNKLLKNLFEKKDSLNKILKNDSIKKKIKGNLFLIISNFLSKIFCQQLKENIFVKPAEGILSQKFNPEKGHFGIDITASEKTPIFASASGIVVFAGYTPEYGNEIIIIHPPNFITKYKHCAVLLKKNGDEVKQGELIALVGNTGLKSKGNHLHFEIWKNNKPVNPENYIINLGGKNEAKK